MGKAGFGGFYGDRRSQEFRAPLGKIITPNDLTGNVTSGLVKHIEYVLYTEGPMPVGKVARRVYTTPTEAFLALRQSENAERTGSGTLEDPYLWAYKA